MKIPIESYGPVFNGYMDDGIVRAFPDDELHPLLQKLINEKIPFKQLTPWEIDIDWSLVTKSQEVFLKMKYDISLIGYYNSDEKNHTSNEFKKYKRKPNQKEIQEHLERESFYDNYFRENPIV